MDLHNFATLTSAQIKSQRARPMVIKELSSHIEDQKRDYMTQGMTEHEAEEEAVRQMGDPVEIGQELNRVHRPQMQWRLLFGIFVLSAVGMGIQFLVHCASVTSPDEKRDYLYLLDSQVFALKNQLFWMIAGIAIMLLVCYSNYTFIGKYAVHIWFAVTVMIILYITFAMPVNGGHVRIVPLVYLWIPAYCGIIYRYKGGGSKEVAKSMLILVITLAVCLCIPSLASSALIGFNGILLLAVTISKGWFGKKKMKMFLLLGFPIAICVIAFAVLYVSKSLELYQEARLQGIFTFQRHYFQGIKSPVTEQTLTPAVDIQGSYLWLYLSVKFGKSFVAMLTIVIFALILIMFRTALRQKNRLGYIIGVGCSLMLLMQSIFYVAINLGYIGPYSGIGMPLMTYGPLSLCVTYVYLGLVLSIYRNQKLVKN